MQNKQTIAQEFIDAWKSLFDLYPELKSLPVYAWGRYYKYENAGSPFQIYPEFGLCDLKRLDLKRLEINEIDWELIKKIDSEVGDKIGNCDIGDYSPNRYDVAKAWNWDDRAGKCLIIFKNEQNELELKCVGCDSPE